MSESGVKHVRPRQLSKEKPDAEIHAIECIAGVIGGMQAGGWGAGLCCSPASPDVTAAGLTLTTRWSLRSHPLGLTYESFIQTGLIAQPSMAAPAVNAGGEDGALP